MTQIAIKRPRNSSGTIRCTNVLDASNCVTIVKPMSSIAASDNQKECDLDSRIRLPPKPAAAKPTQSPSYLTLPSVARINEPRIAPTPEAPISNPNSLGPPCNISLAYTGIKIS